MIASCGLERSIILWSPYSRRSVASLQGHSSSVRQVVSNQEHNQLISLSTDSVVKVWDIRNTLYSSSSKRAHHLTLHTAPTQSHGLLKRIYKFTHVTSVGFVLNPNREM